MINRRFLCLAAALALVAGCATQPVPVSVADTLAQTPSLSTLHGLVVKAGLNDTFKGPGPFTVFAPNNDAFKAVSARTMDELAKDPARLKAVLTYHVVPAQVMAAEVKNGPVMSVQGTNLTLSRTGAYVTVEEAMVVTADIKATNGVVHVVDRVLLPPAQK
ncbi:MAG: fasciclin domain-containing protein [Comamonadaceae bacterium]|jgi:uncharacterized surface protein with fasciclin (FAS1) repeats|uniref:fasciclin domain-containing protein n=1 Tax=Candidatus Skiveiella danica TaxID=3386177 RepID=UPI001B71B3EF|nr:fasciclin domain-containing protein [Comamonadaceae bacterium]MBK9197064.1 fasciclin domain-containing protein [Betaproteobacteria bacterium]MBP6308825.1 fasciclin domain-containing protein [Burkholderiaceae bacterium]MBK6557519.1 fasciclin domain-containing protein [Comamonadaceae bacterium]MBK7990872.1 fasciclin domain-containing protein [Comamonadaceae bacterium]